MMPKRIQRKRTKGWKMPKNTIYVGRPTIYANPFKITEDRDANDVVIAFNTWLTVDGCHANMESKKLAILNNLYRLKGKNLACWCPLNKRCHADILLELANIGGDDG